MSKKQRGARREVRRLELVIAELRARCKMLELDRISAELRLDASHKLNQRLSQTELRTKINKASDIYEIGIGVTSEMLTEFRLDRETLGQLLAQRISFELSRVDLKRIGVLKEFHNEDRST
jgi:hypothetical protein